ncbi:YceD family protein [Spiroplasma endosymbiont of Glossina fuscipes fuscipes]|uniref:YceD family protein n=1 Tax=Spiroplasma endosymbiont of Glossina fuscipes fuscipes TaxID=2004463 RepID=UPI003C7207EB
MIYTEADLIKQPIISIETPLIIADEVLAYSPNIKALNGVVIKGTLTYHSNLNAINVVATIQGEIIVEDARSLEHFKVPINLKWNDEYSFKFYKKSDINYLNEQNFDIIKYAWDEIIMNIPINLSKNSDKIISGDSTWQVFSEEEFAAYQATQVDSRWEQLHEKLVKTTKEGK